MRPNRQFLRYVVVGATATVCHFAVLIACVEAWHWPPSTAAAAGAAIGAQVAFFGNRACTFIDRGPIAAPWLRFQATAALGAALSVTVVGLGVAAGVDYMIGQAVATAIGLCCTFAVNRAWTFRDRFVHTARR